ncbi:MAG: MFS transporter [Tissierellales bacterium]|nr:MFS transporter [Tissierellales bacterium]
MGKLFSRNFILYAAGRIVSLMGSGIQNVAIPLYILRTTGSGLAMGTFAFVQLLPRIIIMPLGGVIGDNFNRKKIMVLMDFLCGFISLILAAAVINGYISLTILFIGQIFLSAFSSIFDASTAAMLPEIISKDNLLKGNSVLGSINSATYIIGPIAGAALFGFFGIRIVLFINGVSFIASAVSEIFIKYYPQEESKSITVEKVKEDIIEGFNFIKDADGILPLIYFAAVANFFGVASITVILPYIFVEGLGFSDSQFGVLQASVMIGIFLGNILLSVVSQKLNKKKIVVYGLTAQAGLFFIIGIFFYPWVIRTFGKGSIYLFGILLIFLVMFGVANAFINTSINTNLQLMIPNRVRARVLSAYSFGMQVISPLGVFVAGIALELIKYYNLFMTCTVMILIATGIFFKNAPEESYNPQNKKAETR